MVRETSLEITLFDLLSTMSNTIDLVNQNLTDHHYKVAYIALEIARQLGLEDKHLKHVVYASLIHDIGALTEEERLKTLSFDFENPQAHAVNGYLLLRDLEFFENIAEVIRFHHTPWQNSRGLEVEGQDVPKCSHLVLLADRVSVLPDADRHILLQTEEICEHIESRTGEMFRPEFVDAFQQVSDREEFWLDLVSNKLKKRLQEELDFSPVRLTWEDVSKIGQLFRRVIDFRSGFTANHSDGVSTVAEELARYCGWNEEACLKMRIAGFMHDLGKLAVSPSILEKPGDLSNEEFSVMRTHTYYTYRSLEPLPGFEEINEWASYHHERLDGTGYPFKLADDQLSEGARIMAVADVFTALLEDRPYREAMEKEKALNILRKMANNSKLDVDVLAMLEKNYSLLNKKRLLAQNSSRSSYQKFTESARG